MTRRRRREGAAVNVTSETGYAEILAGDIPLEH